MRATPTLRILAVMILATCAYIARGEKPDFAYPVTVIENADKALAKAMTPGNDPSGADKVKAMLEICVAKQSIDPDSAYALPARVLDVASHESNPAGRAMMLTLAGDIYYKIYSADAYRYNNVTTPSYPLPANPAECNGEQFKSRIDSLMTEAYRMALSAGADDADLRNYADVLTYNRTGLQYFPSVADFVALKASEMSLCDELARRMIGLQMQRLAPDKMPGTYWNCAEAAEATIADDPDSDKFLKLYRRYRDSEAAVYYLVKWLDQADLQQSQRAAAVAMIDESLTRWPGWWQNTALQNRRITLTRPHINITHTALCTPGDEIKVNINYYAAHGIGVELYRLNAGTPSRNNYLIDNFTKIDSRRLPCRYVLAPNDTVISMRIDKAGMYLLRPVLDGKPTTIDRVDSYRLVTCTPAQPVALNSNSRMAFMLIDPRSGAPLQADRYTLTPRSRNKAAQTIDVAPEKLPDVWTRYPLGKRLKTGISYELSAIYRGKRLPESIDIDLWVPDRNRGENTRIEGRMMTYRAIYHPGDTLAWSFVAYTSTAKNAALLKGRKFEVTLYNANYQKTDSMTVTTDDFGRADGRFILPVEGLTGHFRIKASTDGINGNINGNVMVSDFKMPSIEARIDSTSRMPDGAVTIYGSAKTYSGAPVAGARVSADIREAMRLRWFIPQRHIATVDSCFTDADGHFAILIPRNMLQAGDTDSFQAEITVTSLTAETASAETFFTTGTPYALCAETDRRIDAAKQLRGVVRTYDASGRSVNLRYRYRLSRHGSTDIIGESTTDSTATLDWSNLPVGKYDFEAQAVDTVACGNIVKVSDIIIYNSATGQLPAAIGSVYLPQNDLTIDRGQKVRLTFGVPTDDTWVYTALCFGDSIGEITARKYNAGFHAADYAMPASADKARIIVMAMRDGVMCNTECRVEVRRPESIVKLRGETFRNRLTPGTVEHWRLTLTDGNGRPAHGALVLTMYNAALNQLMELSWPAGNLWQARDRGNVNLEYTYFGNRSSNVEGPVKYLDDTQTMLRPTFDPAFTFRHIVYMRKYSAARRSAAMINEPAVMEAEYADEATATTDGAATVVTAAYGTAMNDLAAKEEAAEETVEADAGSNATDTKFEYRDSEVLQALWRPRMLIDSDGNTELTFTVPNANTTWQLKGYAWTDDLRGNALSRTFMASKPVMVQPNLPRFMRQGDRATIAATVFNRTDSAQIITTAIEVTDGAGAVLATATQRDTIAANASAIVTVDVQAPTDCAAMTYRVRSYTDTFADGEQAAIAVLESQGTVIESNTFYLNPGDSTCTVAAPAMHDATVTLQYIQNPVWEVVKSLPDATAQVKMHSSAIAGHVLGSALIIRGLGAAAPELAPVIRQWSKNPADSALVSRLSRNEDLKIAILTATPWVQAAASQSERMARLSMMFDDKALKRNIDAAIATLQKLQNSDGGFSWGTWSQHSSLYATLDVLAHMGVVQRLGFMPDDKTLRNVLGKAIDYCDRTVSSDKNHSGAYELSYAHAMLPQYEASLSARQIIETEIQKIIGRNGKGSLDQKACDALILWHSGNRAVAGKLARSIRQFGVRQTGRGIFFPSAGSILSYASIINALATIDPQPAELDAIRQGLIVRLQANDKFGVSNPVYLAASILLTGAKWTSFSPDTPAAVTIDRQPIAISDSEYATGYFACRLTGDSAGKAVTITPSTDAPSYGSVIAIGKQPMTTTQARGNDDIEIAKRILVSRNGRMVETDSLTVGERAHVLLTIDVHRDMQFVAVTDERAATLEPVEQMPGYVFDKSGLSFYREPGDAVTSLFINRLPRGVYQVGYDCTVTYAGAFASGIATVQNQLAPELTAHSSGTTLKVNY